MWGQVCGLEARQQRPPTSVSQQRRSPPGARCMQPPGPVKSPDGNVSVLLLLAWLDVLNLDVVLLGLGQ